jgi:hypothetical protein
MQEVHYYSLKRASPKFESGEKDELVDPRGIEPG